MSACIVWLMIGVAAGAVIAFVALGAIMRWSYTDAYYNRAVRNTQRPK